MEVPCSASLGAMGSLVRKLDGLLRVTEDVLWKNERTWQQDWSTISAGQMKLSKTHDLTLMSNYLFKGQLDAYKLTKLEPSLKQLKDGLDNISKKLEKLSEANDPPLTANYWMKDVRELSYEMEDFVDKLSVHANDDEGGSIPWMDEISGFKARVDEVVERYDRYKLDFVLGHPTEHTVSYHLGRLGKETAEHTVSIGIEEPTNELLELVNPEGDGEADQQLKVVSIIGVEGVGKTTLAKRLWHQLGEKFDYRAFVQTAKNPDIMMVLRSILTQVRPKQPPADEPCDMANLIRCLRKNLQDKRYFIIIDDIWAISVWDVISSAFPDVNCGSRILTTTTTEDIALACCGYEPDLVFNMETLSYYHSKKLFVDRAFRSGKPCPPQFDVLADEISGKCGGLPLAIICLATLIENQLQPELGLQLEYMLNFLRHNLRRNPTSVEILMQVLNLCYSSLPQCLKTCLLYLSVYPQNYLIHKDDLVKQWIAEDFISTTEEDHEAAANCYFDELVSLGLIQRMDISCIKELSYVVHPTVFEFITCKSIEENFITIIDYHSQPTIALADKIRRLSLHFGSTAYASTPSSIEVWQVRSLTFMGLLNCMPSLVNFKLARAVILHVLVDSGDTRFSLAEICKLLLLRYLQVRCNVTVELPDQMGCLKHLETLDINAEVLCVPSDIVHLPRLLHLHLGRKRDYYHNHQFLNYLPSGSARSFVDSSSASSNHIPIYEFLGLIPRPLQWIGHFRNLRYLDVVVRQMHTYEADVLAELWTLTVLSLCVRTPAAGGIRFKRAAFPALRYLIYKCGGETLLMNFESGAMPNLWRFHIGLNAHRHGEYGHMLAGIQHLLNLQEVSASIGVAFGADESDRRAAESAFHDAISRHPCFPSLKVNRFDGIDGEYEPSEKNWVQEIEQHGPHRDTFSNGQPGVLGKMPGRDMKQHAGTSDEHHQTQTPKKALSFLLWLCLTILAVTTLYKVWVQTPRAVSGRTEATGTRLDTKTTLLSTLNKYPMWYKVFLYCNSLAFTASSVMIIIILLQAGVGLDLSYFLKGAMILDILALMGAFLAGSPWDTSILIFMVTVLAVSVLVHVVVAIKFSVIFGGLSSVEDKAVSNRIENGMTAAPVTEYEWHRVMRKYILLVAILTMSVTFYAGGQGLGLPSQCDMGKLWYHVVFDSSFTYFVSCIVIITLLLSMSRPGNKWWLRVTKMVIVVDLLGVLVAFGAATCFARPLDLSLFTLLLYSPIGGATFVLVSFIFCIIIVERLIAVLRL